VWLEEEKDKEKHLNKRLKATNKVLYKEKKFFTIWSSVNS
jgi:hypothetical protein